MPVWSCGFQIEGILLDNVYKSVTKGHMTAIIWKLNWVLGVNKSAKIVDLFVAVIADLFS